MSAIQIFILQNRFKNFEENDPTSFPLNTSKDKRF